MTELLLEITVAIERTFIPILWIALTPLNNDVGFVVKAFLDLLVQCGDPCLVLVSLGLKIGNPGDDRP